MNFPLKKFIVVLYRKAAFMQVAASTGSFVVCSGCLVIMVSFIWDRVSYNRYCFTLRKESYHLGWIRVS